MPNDRSTDSKLLLVRDRAEWRAWLDEHGAAEREVWLVMYKAHTGQASLSYDEAVEEALCCGWIDSILHRIDDEKHAQKFTPRKDWIKWSESNRLRLRKLLPLGVIRPEVLARIPPEVFDASVHAPERPTPDLPPGFAEALAANPAAAACFERLAPGQRRLYLLWLNDAKREETLRKRIAVAIAQLAEGRELGLK